MRVAALDITADPTFLSSFAAFWEVNEASRYDRAQNARAAAAAGSKAGGESSSLLALGRDEVLSLDLDVEAPNIYICQHGSRGFSGSVLMLRLGHMSIRDSSEEPASAGVAHPGSAAATHRPHEDGAGQDQVNRRNRYVVKVERVGVDLLEQAEVQEDDIFCESTVAIVKDTQLTASVWAALALAPSPEHRDTFAIDAALPSLSVCVSHASLLDVTRIIASWSQKKAAQVSSPGGEADLVKGWVLVKGISSQTGWCWRWVSLQHDALEFFREEDELVLDQLVPLSAVQASSEHAKGVWVISLQRWQTDSPSDADAIVHVFAAAQHAAVLSSIWEAQVCSARSPATCARRRCAALALRREADPWRCGVNGL